MRFFRGFVFLSITLLAPIFSSPVYGLGTVVSAKAMGMGNVGVAYPQDGFAAAFNPAGISIIGNRMDVELSYEYSHGRTEITQATPSSPIATNVTTGLYDNARAHHFAYPSVGISGHFCDDCSITWGLVAYPKEKIITSYSSNFPSYGTSRAGLELFQEMVSASFAVRYYCHHFGISANFCVERFYASGLESFDTPWIVGDTGGYFTTSPGNVTNRSPDYSTGWSYTVGWIGHVLPNVTLGAVYEARAKMTRMKNYEGLLAEGGRINFPERISAGFSCKFCDSYFLAMDVHFIHWSDVDSLNQSIFGTAASLFKIPLGFYKGPGFGWTDQTLLRIGLEKRCRWWDFRVGFQYGKPPVKPSQATFNRLTLETIQTQLSFGCSYRTTPSDEVSLFVAHGVRNKIHGAESSADFGSEKGNITNIFFRVGISYGRHW